MKLASLTSLALTPALVLAAQAPSPTLSQRLAAEQPEVERLMAECQSRDALTKAEGLLPKDILPFDKSSLSGSRDSYLKRRSIVLAYYLAGRAAFASGYWEKALDYYSKARDVSKENYDGAESTLTPAAKYYRNMVANDRRTLETDKAYIQELQSKKNPDEGEKQQLELVKGTEDNIVNNEKWAKVFEDDVALAKKDSDYFATQPDEIQKYIKSEQESLDNYKFPGDKVKWVEGTVSSKATMDQLPDKQSKVQYLYRLNVLDPSNKKVLHEIDVLLGKATAEAPKHPAPKKKG